MDKPRSQVASRLPSLKAMRAFEITGRHLKLNDAAEELNITPSAVSHQIRLLEDELDTKLFARTGRGLELTDRGAELLPLLSSVFADLAAVVASFRQDRSSGAVSIDMPASFATRWFIPNLARFETLHPDLDVRLTTSETPSGPPPENLDCAIRFGHTPWSTYQEHLLFSESLVVVCSPRLLTAGALDLDEAYKFRLLTVGGQPDEWNMWFSGHGLKQRRDTRTLTFQTRELAIQGAVESLGLALASMVEVADELRQGSLTLAFSKANQIVNGSYFLGVARNKAADPRVSALVDWIKSEFVNRR